MKALKEGTTFWISGDSQEIGIKDYNVNVLSFGTIIKDSSSREKYALVILDNIDGDRNVCTRVKKQFMYNIK